MDLKSYVDGFGAMTCVVSVEDFGNGKHGDIRIVTGNKAYIDSIENPAPGAELLVTKFEPNSLYTTYLTRDLNFEEFCYRAAVEKKCLHSYAQPDRMAGVWFNMTFLPVAHQEGNICYCTYTMEINFEPDSTRLSSGISSDIIDEVFGTMIKLRTSKDFNSSMYEVIDDIRKLCDAEYGCILLMNSYERTCSVLCESISEESDLKSMNVYLDDSFYDIADSWKDVIAGSNCLIAKNEQDMEIVKERNPEWYESITGAGCYNIVLFPLKFRDTLLGYIWVTNFKWEKAVRIKETLETTTFILSSEIYNSLLMDQLKILSSKDMLTGVMNRNEMNNYVDRICSAKDSDPVSIGVIFTDLNGLKIVNDKLGHTEGDILLKKAAQALEEVFDIKDIYRAGGDEFTMIVSGVKEDDLTKMVASIREAAEKYDVSFAVGAAYEPDRRNVKDALRIADEKMYEDKDLYYKMHPEKKR